MSARLLGWAAFLFGLFHVWANVFATLSELWFAAIHFGGFGALCALSFHAPAAAVGRGRVLRVILALASLAVPAYLILFEDALYARDTEFIATDFLVASLAIVLAIEFTRRTSGRFMPVLIVLSLAYVLFLGRHAPGIFRFPGLSLETVLYRSYFSSEGMFGFVAGISATYVYMFILFGAFLLKSGAGEFIVRLAGAVAGRFAGGAGYVAVMGSGLMASVSGSAVANAVSTGVVTIPMMKRAGFPARTSAAIEAAASTGGQLMPPVMGAGAFVIASSTQIPYLKVIAVSLLPALLYFLSVAYIVRIEALRLELDTSGRGAPKVREVLGEGWHFLIPMAVLVGSLAAGFTPVRAVFFAILAIIAMSWLTGVPMTARRCFDAVVDSVRTMTGTALLLVAVGLVINAVTTTGLGNAFSLMIVEWAGGSLLITLILVAVASLILGMGLPVTASYIVLATLAAPMIYDLVSQQAMLEALRGSDLPESVRTAVELFGGSAAVALEEMPLEMKDLLRQELLDPAVLAGLLLAAHLVIFWLSQDSNVTPPVCLAAFAAAGVAGTRPMATGFTAWRFAKGLYLVPLLFAYTPLITGSWPERLEVFAWSALGLYALVGLFQWYLERPLHPAAALLLAASAVLLLWAPFGALLHMTGACLLAAVVLWQRRGRTAAGGRPRPLQ